MLHCIRKYATEEGFFELWLQLYLKKEEVRKAKIKFDVQIHDGSLGFAVEYGINHSVCKNSIEEIEKKVSFVKIENIDPKDNNTKEIDRKNEKEYLNIKIPYNSLPFNFFKPSTPDPIFSNEPQSDHSFKFVMRNEKWKAGFIITWDKNQPKFDMAKKLWDKIQECKLEKDDDGVLDYSYSSGQNIARLKIEITEKDPTHQLEIFNKIIISLNKELTTFLKEKSVSLTTPIEPNLKELNYGKNLK